MSFEPKILALCCHYCAYAAADLAGSMRMQYPPNVRVLRLPCTGKLDIGYILKAFEKGVDGVIVAGCLEGGCHFQEGNLRARKRTQLAKQILEEAGFESDRLEMYNLSSAEGPTFARIVTEMTERIKQLGPNPLRSTSHPGACDPATCRPTTCHPTTCHPTTCHPEQSEGTAFGEADSSPSAQNDMVAAQNDMAATQNMAGAQNDMAGSQNDMAASEEAIA